MSVYEASWSDEMWGLYEDSGGQKRLIAWFICKADADFAAVAFARRQSIEWVHSAVERLKLSPSGIVTTEAGGEKT